MENKRLINSLRIKSIETDGGAVLNVVGGKTITLDRDNWEKILPLVGGFYLEYDNGTTEFMTEDEFMNVEGVAKEEASNV